MRLELALIVGILFFCSWCAYIVARMNSSVSAGESAASLPQNSNQANWSTHATRVQDSYQPPNNQSQPASQAASARHQQVQRHHFGASEPEGAWQQQQQQMGAQAPYTLPVGLQLQQAEPDVFHQRPYLAPSSPPQAEAPTGWQAYALPTRLSTPSTLDVNQFGPAPELLDPQSDRDQPDGDERRLVAETASEPADYEDEDATADDYVTPQYEEAPGEAEPDNSNNESDDQEAPPEAGNELDELSQRRVFNELESDSTERDIDGNLLVTRSRHLINGKPVGRSRRRQPVAEIDENTYAESAREDRRAEARPRPDVSRAQEADFERLVGEFEREDELRKLGAGGKLAELARTRETPTSGGQEHQRRPGQTLIRSNKSGRPKWSVAETPMRRTASGAHKSFETQTKRPTKSGQRQATGSKLAGVQTITGSPANLKKPKQRKAKKKEEHEHRLQETLDQQQWDDDSATSVDQRPESADEANEEKVGDIVEQDQEARQLEDLSRELMLNPQFAELTRRRRSVVPSSLNKPTPEVESPPQGGRDESDEETADDPERAADCTSDCHSSRASRERPRDESRDDPQDRTEIDAQVESVDAEDENEARTLSTNVNQVDPDSPIPITSDNNSSGGQLSEAISADYEPIDLPITEGPFEPSGTAQEPPPSNRSVAIRSEIGSPIRRNGQMSSASQKPTELVSGQEDMHVEVLAQPPITVGLNNFSAPVQQPQWAQSAPAQPAGPAGLVEFPRVASPFASGSSKVGKKKARNQSKKRSKMIDSKYKAARAYAKKQRSKQKKGQMRKKKRKSEKKLIAGAKHFAGSTRGHKKAHGRGIKGARKGSTYLKDKGYKKKGFKKAYHKLETGDHKTYYDEFRDKDHNKHWKDFDDKHKYSQRKKWAGNDVRHLKHHDSKEARGKASKSGRWKESAVSEHVKKAKKFKKANKVAKKSYSSEVKKKKKKS